MIFFYDLNILISFFKMNWSDIGPAFCINLRTRIDRKKEATKIFEQLNIPIEFHTVDKHPISGTQGCFESHIQIITLAYNSGYSRCIIFEDDITPSSHCNSLQLNKVIQFINKNVNWDIFYLGVLPDIRRKGTKIVSPNIYQLQGICTHAYIINRKMMERLIGMKYIGIPIDYLYMQLDQCYAIYPTMFYQGLSPSDITTTKIYSSIQNPSIVRFYYRLQEMYAYYIQIPLLSFKMFFYIICFFLICIIYIYLKYKYRKI